MPKGYKDGTAAYMRQRNENLKSQGRCACCGKSNDRLPMNQCTACAQRQADQLKTRRAARKEQGTCTKCPAIAFSRHLCFKCWLGTTAQNTLGKWERGSELGALWERQKGRCTMTNLPLGADAQLDHIQPQSRGGDHSIENLRWVVGWANLMKSDATDKELLDRCLLIVSCLSSPGVSGRIESRLSRMPF